MREEMKFDTINKNYIIGMREATMRKNYTKAAL